MRRVCPLPPRFVRAAFPCLLPPREVRLTGGLRVRDGAVPARCGGEAGALRARMMHPGGLYGVRPRPGGPAMGPGCARRRGDVMESFVKMVQSNILVQAVLFLALGLFLVFMPGVTLTTVI